MDKLKTLTIFKQISVPAKSGCKNEMTEIVTNGSPGAIDKTVLNLKKLGVNCFEVVDSKKQIKTTYKKLLSGVNYSKVITKL
ncbi:hypothetical protein [Tenacibaculum dicentrarchi]|uniref:hypothetical protein n=1 Tax=Tenacibaculum dicentrarchi TaxID=669041 RepID=UPI003513B4DD